jgi:cell volume regulation protein A
MQLPTAPPTGGACRIIRLSAKDVILDLALMLGAGLIAQPLANLLRLPNMLLLVGAGAILGPAVTGWIEVPLGSTSIQILLTLGVSFILFHGGLQLSARILSRVAVGLGLLVIPGVIITAVICGLVASAVFDLPIASGLLLGAVLAPTDPAILIPLFERIRIRPKISQTIIAESALNDPTGAVLALTFAGIVATGDNSVASPVLDFLKVLGISTGLGIGFGVALSLMVSSRRFGLWGESAAVAVLMVVCSTFFSVDEAGGSGYLGAFIAGLIVGNMDQLKLGMHSEHELDMRALVKNVADVMVVLVFVVLGANLPWRAIADNWLPALAVLATLLFVARPIAVLACLLPDRRGEWTREELVFMGWARETGVVPAALAGLLLSMNIEDADLIAVCVALAIIVTLTLQASTKRWLARRLHLLEPGPRLPLSPSS